MDGAPASTQYPRIDRHLFHCSFQYIVAILLTAGLTGNARTILVVEWNLAWKRELLLSDFPPYRIPKGICKQLVAFAVISHHNRAHPDRWCPLPVGSQRCLHSMRIPLVLSAGSQGASNSPLRNWLRCHCLSSIRRSQNVVERSDTIVNNKQ